MKQKNINVLRKILYAVESGGQVYGKQNYSAFAGVGANTPNEKSITIGAGQWYAEEARKLLKMIQEKYPAKFTKLDVAGIYADLKKSWSVYGVDKASAKGKSIIAIISCTEGVKCQDALMEEQIKDYAKSIEKTYGGMSDTAMMECINIVHQGGSNALKRILAKTKKPYTAKGIYAALNTDPDDRSNNNQVGDYVTRQKKVYEFIAKYADSGEEMEGQKMGRTAQDYLNVWRQWIGFNEANGKFKQIIDLYNSHKPLARGYAVKYTDAWCDTTVSAAAIEAGMVDLIGTECGCEQHINIFRQKGIWEEDGTITPKAGDIILYNWDQSCQPNNGGADHIGVVESVANGQITCIEGNKGEAVARRVISVGNGYIRGFARPKYAAGSSGSVAPTPAPSVNGGLSESVVWDGLVNTAELKVRTWAGVENPQLKSYPTIKQGTKVGVCETVKDKVGEPWYYVKIAGSKGDKYGFVPAMYITKKSTSAPNDATLKDDGVITKAPKWTGKVTADVLNVRSWAGVNNPRIKSWPQLSKGNLVDVCDAVNADDGSRWYYIRIDGRIYGFVHSAYIARV